MSHQQQKILDEFEALIQSELEDIAERFGVEAAAEAALEIQSTVETRINEWIFRHELRIRNSGK